MPAVNLLGQHGFSRLARAFVELGAQEHLRVLPTVGAQGGRAHRVPLHKTATSGEVEMTVRQLRCACRAASALPGFRRPACGIGAAPCSSMR